MNEMKVLIISGTDVAGGATKIALDLAEGLKKYGYVFKFIVAYKKSKMSNVYELKKNLLISALESKTRLNLVSLLRFLRSYIYANDIDFGSSEEIVNHPWYKEADLIHIHNLHGSNIKLGTLSKIASEKLVIWTLHDAWAITAHCPQCIDCKHYNNGNHFSPGFDKYEPMLWNNANYLWNKKKKIYADSPQLSIVTPSFWLTKIVKKSILKNKPLTQIFNGIDVSIFKLRSKREVRKKLNLPVAKKLIIYIGQMGRLDSRKGGDYFLKTAKSFYNNPNVIFLCVGGKVGKKIIKENNIIYIPYITDKKELANYYSAADILLVLSLAETFSMVTAEGLASGLPIVGFNTRGVNELINHKKNGYLAMYRDLADTIRGINFILSLDNAKLKAMSRLNRLRAVKKFPLKLMLKNYSKLYKKILLKKYE
jgi:glycosyltransferase involved in cell wall biosynthesis